MGIDVSGGLIVGGRLEDVTIDDAILEATGCEGDVSEYLLVEKGMDYLSPYYDSDPSEWIVGFEVTHDTRIDINDEDYQIWLSQIQRLAEKFEDITGVEARLIGAQHVT